MHGVIENKLVNYRVPVLRTNIETYRERRVLIRVDRRCATSGHPTERTNPSTPLRATDWHGAQVTRNNPGNEVEPGSLHAGKKQREEVKIILQGQTSSTGTPFTYEENELYPKKGGMK